MKKFLKLL